MFPDRIVLPVQLLLLRKRSLQLAREVMGGRTEFGAPPLFGGARRALAPGSGPCPCSRAGRGTTPPFPPCRRLVGGWRARSSTVSSCVHDAEAAAGTNDYWARPVA